MEKQVEKEKQSRLWMINSKGKPDAILTMMFIAFVLSCVMAIVGMIESVKIGDKEFDSRPFDMGFASVVLIPLITAYAGKRYGDAHLKLKETQMIGVEFDKNRSGKKSEAKLLTESTTEEPEEEKGA